MGQTMNKEIVKATEEVIGVKVENMEGENLGKIKEIMLDKHSGMVRFVVLDFGGLWGIGNKLFAMPWEIFSYHAGRECFVIPVNKDLLDNLEGIDENNWPNMADATWSTSLYNHFHISPSTRSGLREDRMQ